MEIIIGLSGLLVASLGVIVVQAKRISKIKIAKLKAETIIKEANRQSDKLIKDAKYQAEKESKAVMRRADDDISFKKRQLKEIENEVHQKATHSTAKKEMLKNYRQNSKKN